MFGEARIVQQHGRDIEPVQPDHRLRRGIAVVVPLPARSQHQVERSHDGFFAVDGGEGAFALHHEPQGALRVAVAGGDFAGQHGKSDRVELFPIGSANDCRLFANGQNLSSFDQWDQPVRDCKNIVRLPSQGRHL